MNRRCPQLRPATGQAVDASAAGTWRWRAVELCAGMEDLQETSKLVVQGCVSLISVFLSRTLQRSVDGTLGTRLF